MVTFISATDDPMLMDWLAELPVPTSIASNDLLVLEHYIEHGEKLFQQLPAKRTRNDIEQSRANFIQQAQRTVRANAMRAHAEWIYSQLTDDGKLGLRLADLVYAAADRFPGLVPTRMEIMRERECLQVHKEGREIDQGIFFSGLLNSQKVGLHLLETMLHPTTRAKEMLDDFKQDGVVDLGRIKIERSDFTSYLTIHNVTCLNAEDDRLIEDLETAVDLALLDDNTHVCVLRGCEMTHPKYAGKRIFSAGVNLKDLHLGRISYVDFMLRREMGYISKIFRGLLMPVYQYGWGSRKREKPWIAAVDGFAIGGGAQLLLVFDHVIAESASFFSLPAAQEGIVPGASNLRLSRSLGFRKARQVILDGRRIWAHEPDSALLIDQIAESSDMETAIKNAAARLNNPAVNANRRMLALADEPIDAFRVYMAEFALEQACRLYSPDVLEKVRRA